VVVCRCVSNRDIHSSDGDDLSAETSENIHSSNPELRRRVSAERSLSIGSFKTMSDSEAIKRIIFNTKWWVRLIKVKMVKE
jgi:hypothetical protein